jgi:hypothetical protein
VLLAATFARVNKLIFFLLFNIFGLLLVSITSASGVHHFLYEHIIFFKVMRNLYYFFWLAILPMAVLLSVTAFRSLLTAIQSSPKKKIWLVYIIICHLLFVLFLCRQQGILSGAWLAVFISAVYFLIYCCCENKISYSVGFCAILLAVFIQSAQVYGLLQDRMYQLNQYYAHYGQTHKVFDKKTKISAYYDSHWFDVLLNYIDQDVLDSYTHHKFIIYDNVAPYDDSLQFLKVFEKTAASNMNVAYVSRFESAPRDWRGGSNVSFQADVNPVLSGKLSVISFDANTWKIKTHLPNSEFLVVNDNYNSSWHAFINGRPARLLRANVSFKGLWVPSGDSDVVLRFSDPTRYMLHIALIILFSGTLVYLLVLLKTYV